MKLYFELSSELRFFGAPGKPGLLDQPIQSEDTDTGPRRSHRLKDA